MYELCGKVKEIHFVLRKYLKLVEDCLFACIAVYLFPYTSGRKISYWCRFEVGSGLTNSTHRRLYVVGCLRQPIDLAHYI